MVRPDAAALTAWSGRAGESLSPFHKSAALPLLKDAALLSRVAGDVLRAGSANWQLEVTSVLYAQRPLRPAFDLDYLSSLALAHGLCQLQLEIYPIDALHRGLSTPKP